MWRTEGIVGLTCEPVMSMGMSARMASMRIQMCKKKHCKPMMDQRRMWRTEGIVGLTCEPVMLPGMSARMSTMRIWMRRKKQRKPMMDQHRMWRTEGKVLESSMIGQYISDLQTMIMAKQMQRQAMDLKRKLYCNT